MDSQLAVSIGKSLLPAAFTGARWILVTCIRKAAAQSTGNQRQILENITTRLQPDTRTILDALESIHTSELQTAKQYLIRAIKDLGSWKKEESKIYFDSTRPILELTDVELSKISIHSRCFDNAMDKLRTAHHDASLVFNGKQNKPKVRLQALDIMIFCITLQHWNDGVGLFEKWQTEFIFLFQDHHLAQYAFCEQNVLARLLRKGDSSRLQMAHMLSAIACVTDQMAQHYTTLAEVVFLHALDFSRFIENRSNSLLIKAAKGVARNALPDTWYYEHDREFLLPNNTYSYIVPGTDERRRYNIALFSSGEKVLITSERLFWLTVIKPGTIWAINSMNAIVSIELNECPENRKMINNEKKWIIIGCAQNKNRIYAKAVEDNYISVIDIKTKKIIEGEKIRLPSKVNKGLNFEWGDGVEPGQETCYLVAPNGFIIFYGEEHYNRSAPILREGQALRHNINEPLADPNSNPDISWNRSVSHQYPFYPFWRNQVFTRDQRGSYARRCPHFPLLEQPEPFESMSEFSSSKIITLDSTDGHTCVIRIGFGRYYIDELFIQTLVYQDDSVIFNDFHRQRLSFLGETFQLFKRYSGQKPNFADPLLFTVYGIQQYTHSMNSFFLRSMHATINQDGKLIVQEYRPKCFHDDQSREAWPWNKWPPLPMTLYRNYVADSGVIFIATGGDLQQFCYLSSDEISNERRVEFNRVEVFIMGHHVSTMWIRKR